MTNNTRLTILRSLVLLVLALRSATSYSVGLGPLRLQSALGQPFRANVQVLGPDAHTLTENCIRTRLTTTDGSEISRPDIDLKHVKGANSEINLSSTANLDEPAVTLLIDITCSPTLHRDYQLLLDLRDGLPRVLSTAAATSKERKASTARNASAGDDGATELSRSERRKLKKKRTKPAVEKSNSGLDDAESIVSSPESPVATKSRSKAAPAGGNVLKLSQEDLTLDEPFGSRSPPRLKLSDSLSGSDEKGSIGNIDEVNAAKLRFASMMRDEDPVLSAQKQIKTLQDQLQQNGIDVTGKNNVGKDEMPFNGRATPGFNKWLIVLAVLLVLGVGVVVAILRPSRRPKEKSVSPWWIAGADSASREVDVVKSAREAARAKRSKIVAEEYDLLGEAPPVRMTTDVALERYVDHFNRKAELDNEPTATEPESPTSTETAVDGPKASVEPLDFSADAFMTDLGNDALPAADLRRTGLATFELVSDVMQEAEFWKMLNETQRAIDILETYCNSDSSDSPVPWLYLFDLYTEINDTPRHAGLRERFERKFNGRIPDQEQDGSTLHQSLEDYPHLMAQISELWDRDDVVSFLQGLLINSRDDPRQGFDLLVYREILLLIDVAREREKLTA